MGPNVHEALHAALRAALPPEVSVKSSADLEDALRGSQETPAVHVVHEGYRALESRGNATRIEQTWCLVAVVRGASKDAGREAVWQLASAVAQAVGCLPIAGASAPARLTSGGAVRSAPQMTWIRIPLAVECVFPRRSR